MLGNYAPVAADSAHGAGLELSGHQPSAAGSGEVKVLYRERSHVIEGVEPSTCTLGWLKDMVAVSCCVERDRVRLILGGKLLNDDSQTLIAAGIALGTVVHLFPKPPPQEQQHEVPVATPANTTPTPQSDALLWEPDPALQRIGADLQQDPFVHQTCREVRLWSLLLLTFSTLAIANNAQTVLQTGRLGDNSFDTVVKLLETASSILGVYVAQLGLESARTAQLGIVTKYVNYLILAAVLSTAYRVLWTFDIVFEVKQILNAGGSPRLNNDDGVATDDQGTSSTASASASAAPGAVNKEAILRTYTLRAVTIFFVCLFAWFSCVVRGLRLRWALSLYAAMAPAEQQPPVQAVAEAVHNPLASASASAPVTATATEV